MAGALAFEFLAAHILRIAEFAAVPLPGQAQRGGRSPQMTAKTRGA